MPHRTAAYRDDCVLCSAVAVTACERCAAPLCARHVDENSKRCGNCEIEFFTRQERSARRRRTAVVIGLAAATAAATLITLPLGGVGGAAMAGVVGASATVAATSVMTGKRRTSKRKRQKFLDEKRPRFQPMLPPGPPDADDS